eukprot:m.167525 g.167525  ORF g.167525 m.167525 type:complete len:124 (+) comp16640_c0_seq2:247-618(+)
MDYFPSAPASVRVPLQSPRAHAVHGTRPPSYQRALEYLYPLKEDGAVEAEVRDSPPLRSATPLAVLPSIQEVENDDNIENGGSDDNADNEDHLVALPEFTSTPNSIYRSLSSLCIIMQLLCHC